MSVRPPPANDDVAAAESAEPETVAAILVAEEVRRTRFFFRALAVIATITGLLIPISSNKTWFRFTTAGLCLFGAVLSLLVLLIIKDERRYTESLATFVACLCSCVGVAIIYFVGMFSASAMVLAIGVYFFGMSHFRRVALAAYVMVGLLYFLVAAGVASGLLAEVALFGTESVDTLAKWFHVGMSEALIGMTYLLARNNRRVLEQTVVRARNAQLDVQTREVQLHEAQYELARATRPSDGANTGRKIGELVVGDRIGRGAMGEVYRAKRKNGEYAAIKFIHASLLDKPRKVKRFLREAAAAAAVDSPHVPAIYGSGWTEDRVPYLIMELLEGHDLGWHLRKNGRLDLELVVELCEQVTDALAHVREAGVVHRDLKPANIFLTDSLPRNWKVLDFGLSKILSDNVQLTRDRAVGTPAYMAPEQIRGPKVDHLSDLYALAAIAYRAITGVPPFSGKEVAHVLFRVLNEQPVAPASLAHLPVDVELVLAIGMAKKRGDRFRRVEQFAKAMRLAFELKLPNEVRQHGWSILKKHPWGTRLKKTAKVTTKGKEPTQRIAP